MSLFGPCFRVYSTSAEVGEHSMVNHAKLTWGLILVKLHPFGKAFKLTKDVRICLQV